MSQRVRLSLRAIASRRHQMSVGPDAVLVFDGDCSFCTTVARWSARRFRHGERAQAWQYLSTAFLEQHHLSVDDVRDAAWWVDGDGLRERGHRAVARALLAGGGVRWPVGWLAITPPTSWIAAGVYRFVVRWRYRLPGGTPACKVSP
jgi:predicted DCC family thiol-disulfide oxidoreductase YuxK